MTESTHHILSFASGRHDGLRIPWPPGTGAYPCAITFEEVVFNRHPEPGMDEREALAVTLAARAEVIRCHRYHHTGFVIEGGDEDDDGDEGETHVALYDHIETTEKPATIMDH